MEKFNKQQQQEEYTNVNNKKTHAFVNFITIK